MIHEILDPSPVLVIRNLKLYNLLHGTNITLNDLDIAIDEFYVYHHYKIVEITEQMHINTANSVNAFIDNVLKNSNHKYLPSKDLIFWIYNDRVWACSHVKDKKILIDSTVFDELESKWNYNIREIIIIINNRLNHIYNINYYIFISRDNLPEKCDILVPEIIDYTGYDEIKKSWS